MALSMVGLDLDQRVGIRFKAFVTQDELES
ncbi:hypothetical protein COLO4_15086 [Corchorus olitorius]|uniref:Uncharacterized protein n=1 Tax=Corchorus olitorius TaxID=93759 RepID=A0A1R3JPN3_9ROSI|nr:hypothetical protein COLO4_15086 [Corchorus olitorius]